MTKQTDTHSTHDSAGNEYGKNCWTQAPQQLEE